MIKNNLASIRAKVNLISNQDNGHLLKYRNARKEQICCICHSTYMSHILYKIIFFNNFHLKIFPLLSDLFNPLLCEEQRIRIGNAENLSIICIAR